jgi:hypothetical protein
VTFKKAGVATGLPEIGVPELSVFGIRWTVQGPAQPELSMAEIRHLESSHTLEECFLESLWSFERPGKKV